MIRAGAWTGVLLLLVAGGLLARCARTSPPDRIILVVIDMLRRDHVSSYGTPTPTPEIDRLAARGRRFERAVSSFHSTPMSMGALFTGRTPSLETGAREETLAWNGRTWCGLARFARSSRDTCLPRSLPTLADELRRAGYWTIGVTSNHLLYEPAGFAHGFDDWSEVGRRRTGTAEHRRVKPRVGVPFSAVHAQLESALGRRPSDRFFLYVHYMDVHDHAIWNASYAEGVARADCAVGELLDRLEREDLLRNAIVVLTSDHGERLGERHALRGQARHFGNPSFETLLRIPLIVAPAPPGVRQDVVRTEDVYRMIRRLAGLPMGDPSLLEPGELFLSEQKWQTYRRGSWKAFWSRRDGSFHLFDLEADAGERRDVAAKYPEVVRIQRARMSQLTEQLASRGPSEGMLTPEDLERLRALGYAE